MDDSDPRVDFCRSEYGRLVVSMSFYTGDRDLAVELTQEALARACRHWGRVERMASPEGWLYRVATNLAKSSFRRRRVDRLAASRAAAVRVVEGADPAEVLTVRSAVANLPERQRMAIVLRYYADLPVKDVASVMGVQEGTVKALTSQAMGRLRVALADSDRSVVVTCD
jgi:RNA polymerase sigma-70 factor (ECF subfamily)